MPVSIQLRRATIENWLKNDPVLASGSVGYILDTGGYVVGDGTSKFSTLLPLPSGPITAAGAIKLVDTDPRSTGAGQLLAYALSVGGRMMLRQFGPSGLDTSIQPLLARNKVGLWSPAGNATTVPGVFGFTAYTALLSASAKSPIPGNMFTRTRRLSYPSTSASAGSLGGARVVAAQVTTGTGSLGGFMKVLRFGISDAGTLGLVPDARSFFGVWNTTTGPTNVNPSTLTQIIGVGQNAGDTNFKIIYGGSAAQTPIDCGPNFPIRANADLYEMVIFCPVAGGAFVTLNRLNTGHSHTSFIAGGSSVTLPSPTTLLTYSHNWRGNNTTASLVHFDLISDYIETDY
jgi:hypothetical protein